VTRQPTMWSWNCSSRDTWPFTAVFSASEGSMLWKESSRGMSIRVSIRLLHLKTYGLGVGFASPPVHIYCSLFGGVAVLRLQPGVNIVQRPARHGQLAVLAPNAGRVGQVGKQAEIDIHGLEGARIRAAGDMGQQGAEGGGGGRRQSCPPGKFAGRKAPGQKANGGAFDISFHTRHLAGEGNVWMRSQPQLPIQQSRRIDEGVAMKAAKP